MNAQAWQAVFRQRWSALQPRERLGLAWAAAILGLYLLWAVILAPALHTLEQAPARQQQLDSQLHRMQAWRAQVEALKNQPQAAPPQWRQELGDSVRTLGSAELTWIDGTAIVRLKACTPSALGQWLSLLPQWRLQVSQASLRQNDQGLWQGQVTVKSP